MSISRRIRLTGIRSILATAAAEDTSIRQKNRDRVAAAIDILSSHILAKANHLIHPRIGEYVAMIAMADMTGHYGVGVLLESCFADKLAFVERARRLIRNLIEARVVAKLAA